MIDQKDGSIRVPLSSVKYFASDRRTVHAVTTDEEYTFYEKLGNLESQLPDTFVRIHNRYLVHMKYIEAVRQNTAVVGGTVGSLLPQGACVVSDLPVCEGLGAAGGADADKKDVVRPGSDLPFLFYRDPYYHISVLSGGILSGMAIMHRCPRHQHGVLLSLHLYGEDRALRYGEGNHAVPEVLLSGDREQPADCAQCVGNGGEIRRSDGCQVHGGRVFRDGLFDAKLFL